MEPSYHNGDWENVMVTLSEDASHVAAVTYWLHGQHYTRLTGRGGVELTGTHPVVYPGRYGHGSYFGQGGYGTCAFNDDARHPSSSDQHLDSWANLISLDGDAEGWLAADRMGGFVWGIEGVSTHPTTSTAQSCNVYAASWEFPLDDSRPYTECELDDDDTGFDCHSGCPDGWTEYDLTCTDWSGSWATIGRSYYGYDYTLPTTDRGLVVNGN
jgi:hypothetical protein